MCWVTGSKLGILQESRLGEISTLMELKLHREEA